MKRYAVGVDAGSRAVKVAIVNAEDSSVVAAKVASQGVDGRGIAYGLFQRILDENAIRQSEIAGVVATGYGRNTIDFADMTVTEITCHARGVHHLLPEARTVVEVGGQDSKLLILNEDGSVRDFAMNDRCAAGTGRFLEVVADRLGVGLDSLGELAARSRAPAAISSMCIVFAETEIISLLSSGTAPEDIVAGIQSSMAARIAAMSGGRVVPPVAFTGGVALVTGMDRALEAALRSSVMIVPSPQMTGALGAALLVLSR